MPNFSHFNDEGEAQMVDVGGKSATARSSTASCIIRMQPETCQMIREGGSKKGDVLGVARVAGIMAAKRTAESIPLCHPISLDSVELCFDFVKESEIKVTSTVKTHDRTGVEMEALHAAGVCGLTIYDMCKSADREMEIVNLRLESKSGGKSGNYKRST